MFEVPANPAHPALILDDVVVDYASVSLARDQVAAALQRDGLRPGDVAAICAATSIEYVITFLGCLRAGVVVAPLAPSSSPAHLAAMMENAQAKVLFTDAETQDRIPVDAVHPVPRVALDGSVAGTPWRDWLERHHAPQAVTPQGDWPFNLIYSSGTTGVPKGIIQPYSMRWAQRDRGRINGIGAQTISLISTPLYSNTTLVTLLPTLALGGTAVLMRKFDARRYLELAQAHRVTHTMLVPVQYQRRMDFPDFDRYDLSSF